MMTMREHLSDVEMLRRLEPPEKKVDVVLDTDTYNEVDDQFALAYACLSPEKINLKAVYAAPFFNKRSSGPGDGMEKSYGEILRVLEKLGISGEGFAFRGSNSYMESDNEAVSSPAAEDLVKKARSASEDSPLYVLAIGAPTNVASAIISAPDIIRRIVVVWLGAQPHYWRDLKEFNAKQDIHATRTLFESGVPLVQIPAANVAEMLRTTVPELREYLAGRSDIADYLYKIVRGYHDDHFGWSKVIWDIVTVAWVLDARWVQSEVVHAPLVSDRLIYSFDKRRHFMRVAVHVDRDPIYRELFRKLAAAPKTTLGTAGG